MADGLPGVKKPPFLEVGGDFGIGFLEEHAGERAGLGLEISLGIDRLDHRKVVVLGGVIVVFAVCRRHVYDSGTVSRCHEIRRDHPPGFLVHLKEIEPGRVFKADKSRPRK